MSIFTQARPDTRHDDQHARTGSLKMISPTIAAAVEESDSSSEEEAAAAVPQSDTVDEVTVQFRQAYRARTNSTGLLVRRMFAFGSNPGTGAAPPHMRRITTPFTDLVTNTVTSNQSFIAQDPTAPVIHGVQQPATLVAITARPRTGTIVYMFFAQERGLTHMWRAGFYRGTIM